jgi:hypothetical protein
MAISRALTANLQGNTTPGGQQHSHSSNSSSNSLVGDQQTQNNNSIDTQEPLGPQQISSNLMPPPNTQNPIRRSSRERVSSQENAYTPTKNGQKYPQKKKK